MRVAPIVVALALAGCSIVNAPSDHTGGEIAIDAFCAQLADVLCRGHLDCCDSAVATLEECVAAAATSCETDLRPIADDPRTGYSPDAAARALDEARDLVASCDLRIAEWYTRRDGLQGALAGTVDTGEICADRLETVAVPTFLSCNDFTQACRAQGSFPWRCGARAEVTEPCHIDLDCVSGAYCESLVVSAGECRPVRAVGDVCERNAQCASLICVEARCAERTVENTYCNFEGIDSM